MKKKNIGEFLGNLGPELKKEILQTLVASLLEGLKEEEQKDILQSALTSPRKSRELIDMVGHWIKECADSGVSPVEMSKEVLSAISHSYELVTYSTPELRGLFNDWLCEIEKEALIFLKGKTIVDPEMVAGHLRLERESTIFILNKLARQGQIDLQVPRKWKPWDLKIWHSNICGRMPAVPSIVINASIAFDNIPDMESLTEAVRLASDTAS